MADTPIISIVGASGSGKTTLLERLIPLLRQRGYRVAVVKHHPRPGLDLDVAGKDTWRLAQAGADHVALVAPDQVMHRRRLEREPSLEEVAAEIRGVDLILTEGFKKESAPKIEVHRQQDRPTLLSRPEELVAVVADRPLDLPVPQFAPEDIEGLADLIEGKFLTPPQGTSPR